MTDEEKTLVELEQRCKSNSRRLDEMEGTVKDIHEMSAAIKMMGQSIQRLTEEIREQGARVKNLEAIPAGRWEMMVKTVLTAILSAGVGAMLAVVLK